ncbi:MAG TPA: hypothetical protein VHC44_04935, partial [Verrucomicrobiae bacterium]|nr:hypothetical protein [Verrucomicrobiae bacterium]
MIAFIREKDKRDVEDAGTNNGGYTPCTIWHDRARPGLSDNDLCEHDRAQRCARLLNAEGETRN